MHADGLKKKSDACCAIRYKLTRRSIAFALPHDHGI